MVPKAAAQWMLQEVAQERGPLVWGFPGQPLQEWAQEGRKRVPSLERSRVEERTEERRSRQAEAAALIEGAAGWIRNEILPRGRAAGRF